MVCTPPATTRSLVPLMTAWAAKCAACCDEPHWRSMVVPGTSSGRPAASQQVRAMSPAERPDGVDATEEHVLDGAGVDAGALDQRAQHVSAEVGGVDLAEAALAPPDRGADGVDDVGVCCHDGGSGFS